MTDTCERLPLERLAELEIAHGNHADRSNGLCALELVAYLAGEPHDDHPACCCPVLGAFVRTWNDDLPDGDRTRILRLFLPRLIGTRSTPEIEERRAYMALDWLVRVAAPKWLDLTEALQFHAATLRGLEPLTSEALVRAALPKIDAAEAASNEAARAAAGAAGAAWAAGAAGAAGAAWAAGAARAAGAAGAAGAAWAAWAARAAAWAAWAARAAGAAGAAWAAWAAGAARAAWAAWAARAAARAAAGAAGAAWAARAARADLEPTTRFLQESAAELLDRMIRLTEPAKVEAL